MSDATGSMTMTKVSEKSPFVQELLVREDCFILDNGANGRIFVWKGEGKPLDPGTSKPPLPEMQSLRVIAQLHNFHK